MTSEANESAAPRHPADGGPGGRAVHQGEHDDREITDKPSTSADPDDPVKPSSPPKLTRRTWGLAVKRTFTEFLRDQCTDLAASLTYYAVLSLFPALVALVSLLGVFGQDESSVNSVMDFLDEVAPKDALDTVEGPIRSLVTADQAGFALVAGLLGALWTASGYVGAFGRALNRIYEVEEGRPIWVVRPAQLLVTVALLVLAVIAGLSLTLSGPVAEAAGRALGLGDTGLQVWSIAKIPLLVLVAVLALAILYRYTPNVKQPRFRWISVGAAIALVVWAVATLGFGAYVTQFGSYNKTYGSLAGIIVFLLWVWISNVAILFGAEIDAEMERGRQLQAGMEAEKTIQLPPRSTKASDQAQERYEKMVAEEARVRRAAIAEDVRRRTYARDGGPGGSGSTRR